MSYQNYYSTEHSFSQTNKNYIYRKYSADGKSFQEIKVNLSTGKVSNDVIKALEKLDHECYLNERYSNESIDGNLRRADYLYTSYENNNTKCIFGSNSDRPYNGRFKRKLAGIYDYVENNLSPALQTIFYRHLLLNESLKDIQRDEFLATGKSVSQQAWSKRKATLIKKLKKYLLGED